MAGTAVPQTLLPGSMSSGGGDCGGALINGLNPSDLNDFRISVSIDRLNLHVRSQRENDAQGFFNLCLSLARGIDVAIAHHELPSRAQDLPSLAKQVCQYKNNTFTGAIMVFMISVKSACQRGWFPDKDSEELQNLAKEMANKFGSASPLSLGPSCSHSIISTVMSRFFPRLKMGHVFAFLEVKPGFEAYLTDFQIPLNLKPTSPAEKIMLFVVHIDNIETSSCLISPAKVNFFLNGKGVKRRTCLFVDNGPQIPTAVTNLLKHGPNLFQAVGDFIGNYIIGVAIMSELPNPDSSILQDYNQHAPATVDSDSEIIEGPSRISLNCPISFTRIKTPVKGHSCKHMQCFDFENYVSINSRRPSWRCPHCNQHVCFTDLRIDKKLVKVLKEAESGVSHIIISADGSWNPVMNSEDATQKPEEKNLEKIKCDSRHPMNAVDLIDDTTEFVATNETQDMKPFANVSQNHYIAPAISIEPHTVSTDNANEMNNSQSGDSFWSEVFLSTLGQTNVPSNIQNNGQCSYSPPVLTTSGQIGDFGDNNALPTILMPQMGPTSSNVLQLQQYLFGNSNFTAEYGRIPCFPRNVTRVPTAVQALPAQASSSVHQQRSTRASVGCSSAPHESLHQSPQLSSPLLHQYSGIQENHMFPQQQVTSHPLTNQMPNLRITGMRKSQFPVGPIHSSQSASTNILQQQQSPVLTAPSYSINPNRLRTSPMAELGTYTAVTSSPQLVSSDDRRWQPPVGRMRGALTGQAYVDAYNRFINQNQTNQVNHPSGGAGVLPNGSLGML